MTERLFRGAPRVFTSFGAMPAIVPESLKEGTTDRGRPRHSPDARAVSLSGVVRGLARFRLLG
jgi:hypothetical protein